MILKEESSDILTGGLMKETGFSMDESSLHIVFDILRSKVYKDPISSICREVASNSRDAQREIADYTTPIEIEISDKRDELWIEDGLNIIFRDFGIGLTPDRIENVYSKYGASTKRDSNNMTGGFGLGAKTPFSYADSFTVRTIVDNIEYYYTIYIDESKKGKIALIHEAPLERKGNLTEIIIPIKNNKDLEEFQTAVIKNTYFWDIRPNLIGFKENYNSQYHHVIQKRDNDLNFSISRLNGIVHSGLNAVIDGIYYPIDTNIMSAYKNKNEIGFILYFGNGELSVSANRESLQYDNNTKDIIEDRMNKILGKLSKELQDEINTFSTEFQSVMFLNKKKTASTLNNYLISTFKFHFKGNPISAEIPTFNLSAYTIYLYEADNNKLYRERVKNIYSNEIIENFDRIYLNEIAPYKSDPQRTNTLRGNKWIIISKISDTIYSKKQTDNYQLKCDNELKKLQELGLPLKKYEDVVRTPNEKKPRQPKVIKPVIEYKKIEVRAKISYNGYAMVTFYVHKTTGLFYTYSKIDDKYTLANIVCYLESSKKMSTDGIDDIYSDVNNIFNKNLTQRDPNFIFFVKVTISKEKLFEKQNTIFEFFTRSEVIKKIDQINIREYMNEYNPIIGSLIKYNTFDELTEMLNLLNDVKNNTNSTTYYGIRSLKRHGIIINTVFPVLTEIDKYYPLVKNLDHYNDDDYNDPVVNYIQLVNNYNKVKKELESLKNNP